MIGQNGLEILDDGECVHLLHSARVGRVGVNIGGAPAVLPVNYVMVGSDIMFFTGEGLKMNAALRADTVTFEVDEVDVDEQTGWSVLALGVASNADHEDHARVESLGLYPWAAGERNHLVRIRPSFLSGRRILTGHETGHETTL